jgi:diguanylate cyclase (GGDEF)-like protein
MKTNPDTHSQDGKKPGIALNKVLGQTKEVKGLVDEAAQELSSVNADLKQELDVRQAPPGVEKALERTETVEDIVQDAADKLTDVNAALKDEVHERHALEVQLLAVTEKEEAVRYASVHDALTGLPNRALFNDRLEHGLAQAKRHNWNLAVMFIDLDGFKKINDSYGHDAGDSVLKTIAARLTENTRDDDTVSRYGGDEFLYLLTEVENEQDLTSIADKLIESIQTPCTVRIGDLSINPSTSASIGIALFPKDGTTADALIKSADQAMYRAKGSTSRYLFAQ